MSGRLYTYRCPRVPRTSTLLTDLKRYIPLWLYGVGTFVLDQLTKEWIHRNLPFETFDDANTIVVIPGVFNIVHVGNTGAAWGMFRGASFWLALLAVATLGAIYRYRQHLGLQLQPVQIAFGVLTGGIVGNLIDRIRHDHVIDFLDIRIGSYIWPTFNIADCGIVVGVLFYLALSFWHPKLKVS